MEHVKLFIGKLNPVKVVKACERARLWKEATYVYVKDHQYDSAVKTMMEHFIAFNHDQFMDIIVQVRNQDLSYKAVKFYLEHEPTLLSKLLSTISSQLDHTRAVKLLKAFGDDAIQLARDYLKDA